MLEAIDGNASELGEFDMIDRLAELSGYEIPQSLAVLKTKERRFKDVIAREEQQDYVLKQLSV